MKRRNLLLATAALGCAQANSQDRPTSIIVPYAPGGSLDTTARLLAEQLRKSLGRTFVVDNKAGATGTSGNNRETN